ncbi:MAG: hypothetical protein RL264_2423 [Bacteroidota bacterium]|jgi:gliding motility-associated-like protein
MMKHVLTLAIFTNLIWSLNAQITITPNGSAATLVSTLVGNGITTSNPTLNCGAGAYGTWTGNLQAGGAQLSNGGIVLTTGSAAGADGPNNSGSTSTIVTGYDFTDPHLTTQPGAGNPAPARDNCVLEFDMTPVCNQITVSFVFGSEEYPEFVTGSFNDGFGIFISGPNPAGGSYNNYNCARLPNGQLVSIDNVNANTNATYYNTNPTGNASIHQYDGYTDGLSASLAVVPCSTYHVKIIIADAGDESWDSGLFLGAFSFACSAPALTIAPVQPICAGQTATLTATPTQTGGTYAWSPGGMTTQTITVNPSVTTTYTCSYTLGGSGCSAATATATVTVNPTQTPTFTQLGPYCENATPGALPTTSTNNVVGTWSPTAVSTTIVGQTTYTFTPNAGQCGTTTTMNVTINPGITPTFNIANPLCQNSTPPALPTTSTNSITGTWSPSTISTVTNGTTTYNFTPNAGQCAASVGVDITVASQIVPTFTQIGPLCQFSTAPNLPATSTNNINGTWTPSTISTNTAASNTFTFNPLPNQCAVPTTMNITIDPQITPTFTQITPICQGANATVLPSTSNNSVAGTWNPAFINTASPGTQNFTFTPSGGNCTQNAAMSVVVIPINAPTISSNLTEGCTPLAVQFNAANVQGYSVAWTINGMAANTNSSFSYNFTTAGCYDVTCVVSNQGCTASATINDMICVETAPIVNFQPSSNQFFNDPQTIFFTNNTTGATSFVWDFGNGTVSDLINPECTYTNINSNQIVTLTATTEMGCEGVGSTLIKFNPTPVFYIPNSFTPDEDEFNQTWGPVFTSGFDPYNFELIIFNRWGEVIFESHDAKGRWDGSYGKKGIKAPKGVYTFKIEFKTPDNDDKVVVKGHVNMIR